MLAKESRVSKGLEFGGESLPRPGLGKLPSGTDPSFTLPTLELFLTSGVTCLSWYLTLTALLRESKKVTSEESTHLTGSPAV